MPRQQPNLVIKLVRSPIGYTERQKKTVRALGLRRLQHQVERPDNEAVRGMIFKIQHLLEVRPAEEVSTESSVGARSKRTMKAKSEGDESPKPRRRSRAAADTKETSGDETA